VTPSPDLETYEEDDEPWCDGCSLPKSACCCPEEPAEFTDEDL
jgi:hypothetical protein